MIRLALTCDVKTTTNRDLAIDWLCRFVEESKDRLAFYGLSLSEADPWDSVRIELALSTSTGRRDGLLAIASLHFLEGPLAGLHLSGFHVRGSEIPGSYAVEFPSRPYRAKGEDRRHPLLRSTGMPEGIRAAEDMKARIVAAYLDRLCDCAASGNALKPKQHGADPHAKNCAVYTRRTS